MGFVLRCVGCEVVCTAVLEIRKKFRLSLWWMPDNLVSDFGCPDEDLVVLKMLYVFSRFSPSYRIWLGKYPYAAIFIVPEVLQIISNPQKCAMLKQSAYNFNKLPFYVILC